ncbi:50S ribosomal protein L21 [Candidatus Roizmanbacteria bacterium]|nr:50S ribosomal protein L21 [Candidatus Roizmanbacteria bacterium]
MVQFAVIRSGGKQYIVKENDIVFVDRLPLEAENEVDLETLALFDEEGKKVEVGTPVLKSTVKAKVLDQVKGDKVRVAKFKSKVRYRKVRGFRQQLTKLQISSI